MWLIYLLPSLQDELARVLVIMFDWNHKLTDFLMKVFQMEVSITTIHPFILIVALSMGYYNTDTINLSFHQ